MADELIDAVDVKLLQPFLDGRWAHVRDEVREQLSKNPLFHPVHGLSTEDYRAGVTEQARVMGRTPMSKMLFPKACGGMEDTGGAVSAIQILAFGDQSLFVKAGVQWGLFGGAILHLGTERHHERHLPSVMTMELPGCFAMTETGHGSDVQSLRTTATYDPQTQEFVIHTPDEDARKDYIGNAARDGRMAAVFAQLITRDASHGVHAFLVPIRDKRDRPCPGVTIEDCGHKGGLNGVDNGRIWFDQVRVPREALLNRYGDVAPDGAYSSPIDNETKRFFTMLGTLVQGRVTVAGASLSATKVAMAIAIRYGLVRRQFGPPGGDQEVALLDYTQHQRRLLPALATTYALHFAQEQLVTTLHEVFSADSDPGAADEKMALKRRHLESLAAGIKAASSWHASATIQTCREACGGAGYLSVNRLTELKADTDIYTTFEGDNTVLLQLVAKGLLTQYRDEFGDLDMLGMARFAAEQVVELAIERLAGRRIIQRLIDAVPGRDEEANLLDRGYQIKLFEGREERILDGVTRRLRTGMKISKDPFKSFNTVQDHVLLAARAHIDRIVLECFCEAIDRCEDPGVTALLDKVCDLYALSVIEREKGWYLEHDRLSSVRTKLVTIAVNQLCEELRPHAALLVDAFGIPDELVAAPIALGEEQRRQQEKGQAD